MEWKWKSHSCVQLFVTPRTVHGILQAGIVEWVAYHFSSGSSRPKNTNQGLLHWAIREDHQITGWGPTSQSFLNTADVESGHICTTYVASQGWRACLGTPEAPPPLAFHTPQLHHSEGSGTLLWKLRGGSLCWFHSGELQDLGKSVVTWLRTRLRQLVHQFYSKTCSEKN